MVVEDGKLVYKQRGEPVNTTEGSKWIFVLSTSRSLYVGQKKKGTFQHSSFLAGAATTAAGRLVASNGALEVRTYQTIDLHICTPYYKHEQSCICTCITIMLHRADGFISFFSFLACGFRQFGPTVVTINQRKSTLGSSSVSWRNTMLTSPMSRY